MRHSSAAQVTALHVHNSRAPWIIFHLQVLMCRTQSNDKPPTIKTERYCLFVAGKQISQLYN